MQEETADVVPSTDKASSLVHANGKASSSRSHSHKHSADTDEDPHVLMIESLRNQNNELFAQVTALNSKLVKSYDRVSDLEDSQHVTESSLRASNLRITQLETERKEHLSALDTGLLVERAHVTAELTRLMEKASDEASQRGQAENAKLEIEKELDDLSATLFNQANTMVAEARYARAMSEKKADACETAMKSAEEAVAQMQFQMQGLIESRDAAENEVERLREMGNMGKWVDRKRTMSLQGGMSTNLPRLIRIHVPYEEYQFFLSHLRMIRPAMNHAPAFSSLVSLPFLVRLTVEDSDPTLRLDLAPSLNWLTRRSIAAAVQQGQLQVEPMQTSHLLVELATNVGGPSPLGDVSCALCGKIIMHSDVQAPPPSHPMASTRSAIPSTAAAWATTSRFFRGSVGSTHSLSRSNTAPSTPTPMSPSSGPPMIYIFRLSLPPPQKSQPYALCSSGWCLARLQTTCELWRFVRKGIVDKVWEEQVTRLNHPAAVAPNGMTHQNSVHVSAPPVPPRRNPVIRVGSFWEKGLGALGVDVTKTPNESPALPQRELPPPPPPLPARSPSRRTVPIPPTSTATPPDPTEPPALPTTDLKPFGDEAVPSNDEPKAPLEGVTDESSAPEEPVTKEVEAVTVNLNDDVKDMVETVKDVVESPQTQSPGRSASPIKRPTTPRLVALPVSRPSTPTPKTAPHLPPTASPTPPPVPRRAPARRAVPPPPPGARIGTPSPRTSMIFSHKDADTPGRPDRDLKRRSLSYPAMESVLGMSSGDGSPLKKAFDTSPPVRPTTPTRQISALASSSRPSTPPRTQSRASFATAPSTPTETATAADPTPTIDGALAHVDPPTDKGDSEVTATTAEETVSAQDVSKTVTQDGESVPPAVAEAEVAVTPAPQEPSAPAVEFPTDTKVTPNTQPPPYSGTDTKPEEGNIDDSQAESPIDEATSVGDKTWEEKAWKELAKLRADMFWARIGSISAGREMRDFSS
ncbi:hypothetical protein FRB94_003030 [Tulasnella sp. JGI-2019a]|nr:hypothetical protein FRB94_003030 [Tulasnella sp. JGI-2019a]